MVRPLSIAPPARALHRVITGGTALPARCIAHMGDPRRVPAREGRPWIMRIAIIARPLFWAALLFAVTMALLPHPPHLVDRIGDKYQHMLAFGTLTILAAAGWPGAELLRIGERLSFAGALIEVLQSIPALGRDCDIRDWLADTTVIVAVLIVVRLYRAR